eukprot:Gb_34478 [translate_table: standard]
MPPTNSSTTRVALDSVTWDPKVSYDTPQSITPNLGLQSQVMAPPHLLSLEEKQALHLQVPEWESNASSSIAKSPFDIELPSIEEFYSTPSPTETAKPVSPFPRTRGNYAASTVLSSIKMAKHLDTSGPLAHTTKGSIEPNQLPSNITSPLSESSNSDSSLLVAVTGNIPHVDTSQHVPLPSPPVISQDNSRSSSEFLPELIAFPVSQPILIGFSTSGLQNDSVNPPPTLEHTPLEQTLPPSHIMPFDPLSLNSSSASAGPTSSNFLTLPSAATSRFGNINPIPFRYLHRGPVCPGSRPRFLNDPLVLLLIGAWNLPQRPTIGRVLQRHPFSGLVDSAGRGHYAPDASNHLLYPIKLAHERFARQYRCGPPPEFPLASPCSGIVHHLSGPNSRMEIPQTNVASAQVPEGPPRGRTLCSLARATTKRRAVSRQRFCRRAGLRWSAPRVERRTGSRRFASDRATPLASIHFPPDNFKHSLTLFSKSFSSLPRSTCSLSVSRPYLALDEIYHLIRATFPNNPTRRQRLVVQQGPSPTGLSPSRAPPSKGLGPGPPLRTLLQTTIRAARPPDFHAGLFPVRSSLLGESL